MIMWVKSTVCPNENDEPLYRSFPACSSRELVTPSGPHRPLERDSRTDVADSPSLSNHVRIIPEG